MLIVIAKDGWSAGAIPSLFDRHEVDCPVPACRDWLTTVDRPADNGITYRYYAIDPTQHDVAEFVAHNGGVAALVFPPHEEAQDGPTLVFPDTGVGFISKGGAIWEPAHWRTKHTATDSPQPPGAIV